MSVRTISNTYLINLASRPDRLKAMQAQFDQYGFNYTRIDAVMGKNLSPDEIKAVHKRGPLGDLPIGDIGCFLSHRKAWQMMIDNNDDCALIIEDDVMFGERLKTILHDLKNFEMQFDIIKLDRHGDTRNLFLVHNRTLERPYGEFRPLLSKHVATGAYIITRECARSALDRSQTFTVSVDHFLFNRNNSKFAHDIFVQQLIPAAVRQGLLENDEGDIYRDRLGQRTYDAAYWKREFIRGLYEISEIPAIIWNLLKGARFRKINFQA